MRMTEIKDISKLLWHLFATISILQKQIWRNAWLQSLFYDKKGAYYCMDGCSGIVN